MVKGRRWRVPEDVRCNHDWHEKLIWLTQCSLDATFLSTTHAELRDQIARLLAKHGRYDVDGDDREASDEEVRRIERQAASAGRARELVAPREPVPPPAALPLTAEQRAQYGVLVGVWWLCPEHGVNANAHILSGYAYCWTDGCTKVVKSIGTAHEELARHGR